jgi:hypothetical protein
LFGGNMADGSFSDELKFFFVSLAGGNKL